MDPAAGWGAGAGLRAGLALAGSGHRNRRAYDTLTPGGTLAVFGHRYAYVDPAHAAALHEAFESVDPQRFRDRSDDWFHADITDSGLFADVRSVRFRRDVPLDTAAYQRLVRTFLAPATAAPGAAGAGARRGRRGG